MKKKALIGGYRVLTSLSAPAVQAYLVHRARRGKEEADRMDERRGIANRPRPDGPLVWIHAASVGESLSVLPLIERLRNDFPDLTILLTTGTVTSARLMAERLPDGAIHQYAPVDRLPWVTAFLDHWRPDLALWLESELWPNLVTETQRRGIPMVLLNGRMSARSFRLWQHLPGLVEPMLAGFTVCLGQTDTDAERLGKLGAATAKSVGNLKFAGPPLPADSKTLDRVSGMLGERPRWLASSTHPGEEELIAEAHQRLRAKHSGLVTVLAPRHPARANEILPALAARGLTVARRSEGDEITSETDIYLADTMGELGLFYRLADVVFVGGSLVPHGGQNMLEPAKLNCALLHGPHVANFQVIVEKMRRAGATAQVSGGNDLAIAVHALLCEPALRNARARAAAQVAEAERGVLDAVLREISPWLQTLRGGAPVAPSKLHARA